MDARFMEDLHVGDLVLMKKPHPCGSSKWVITRTGADIKIRCEGCGRIVMLDRVLFVKRLKKILVHAPQPEEPAAQPEA